MGEIEDEIKKQYSSSLDSALLTSILAAYDLSDSSQRDVAKDVLDSFIKSVVHANAKDEQSFNGDLNVPPQKDKVRPRKAVPPREPPLPTSQSVERNKDTSIQKQKDEPQREPSASNGSSTQPAEWTDTSAYGRAREASSTLNQTEYASETDNEFSQDGLPDIEHLLLEHEDMTQAEKEENLHQVFPEVPLIRIRNKLRDCWGNYNRCIDELLSELFLEQSRGKDSIYETLSRSVDGFAESHAKNGKKRSRRRNKRNQQGSSRIENDSTASQTSKPTTNPDEVNGYDKMQSRTIWQKAALDIEFIASRTNIARSIVQSTYHARSCSFSATFLALLEAEAENPSAAPEQAHFLLMEQSKGLLAFAFPDVPKHLLAPLVRLTFPSELNASDLLERLLADQGRSRAQAPEVTASTSESLLSLSVQTPQPRASYASNAVGDPQLPPNQESVSSSAARQPKNEGRKGWIQVTPKHKPFSSTSSSSSSTSNTSSAAQRAVLTNNIQTQLDRAIQQQRALLARAAASSRRATSSNNMGAAAAHYALAARDASATRRRLQALAADQTVAANARSGLGGYVVGGAGSGVSSRIGGSVGGGRAYHEWGVDLHGVGVQDALRIVRERLEEWWEVGRASEMGIREGFVIVTGRGLHSAGGRGRIGPAVAAMLEREGWAFSDREGAVMVTGRRRGGGRG